MTASFDLQHIASCVSEYDPNALRVDAALAVIQGSVQPVQAVERLAVRAALGRVLAQDIISPIDVPAHDNSAMDGYALRGADIAVQGDTVLRIAGRGLAGHAYGGDVPAGSALRIMTGAVMPAECDTVVPQEFCRVEGDTVILPQGLVRAGDNRRLRGEDLARGKAALPAGKVLRPADLGLMASLGMAEAPVRRKLRVAFFSSGDELRSVGQPLDPGCVYDSNRYTLWGMLERLGCDIIDLGVVPDNPQAVEAALHTATTCADVVITSGGVSVGEADYLRSTLSRMGEVVFWRIAMRPGRPLAFGQLRANAHKAWLFGLPGNPVAVMVTFYAFVRPALLHCMGASPQPQPMLRAVSAQTLRKKPGRTEYQRGLLTALPDGRWQVSAIGNQGSGVLSSMSQAHGLIMLHHDQSTVQAGDLVDVLLFDGLV
ncbi:MAG: molybdopterin molybdotransferase MoeA [Burkholderiaceae bacterium]|nr:molybdopterin molybdotransferase MoeA [Burkholderiaceae bacterium]